MRTFGRTALFPAVAPPRANAVFVELLLLLNAVCGRVAARLQNDHQRSPQPVRIVGQAWRSRLAYYRRGGLLPMPPRRRPGAIWLVLLSIALLPALPVNMSLSSVAAWRASP